MKTVNVSELEGSALDWAVAQVEGVKVEFPKIGFAGHSVANLWAVNPEFSCDGCGEGLAYTPSTEWNQGGPLIEKYNLVVVGVSRVYKKTGEDWYSCNAEFFETRFNNDGEQYGATALIAVCRVIVELNLGNNIEVPTELLK